MNIGKASRAPRGALVEAPSASVKASVNEPLWRFSIALQGEVFATYKVVCGYVDLIISYIGATIQIVAPVSSELVKYLQRVAP